MVSIKLYASGTRIMSDKIGDPPAEQVTDGEKSSRMIVSGFLLEEMNPDGKSRLEVDGGGVRGVKGTRFFRDEWFPTNTLKKGCKIIATSGNPGYVLSYDPDESIAWS